MVDNGQQFDRKWFLKNSKQFKISKQFKKTSKKIKEFTKIQNFKKNSEIPGQV